MEKRSFLSKAHFLNVWRNITNSVAFWSKIAAFSIFCRNQGFFRKTHLIFLNRSHFLNVLRSLTFSVAFYGKFSTLAVFKKFTILFEKSICFLKNSPNLLPALRNVTCSVAFYSKIATFTVFLDKTFFLKNAYFLIGKTRFWTLWKNGIFQSHFTANLLVSAVFKKTTSFPKTHLFFFKKNRTFESFEKSYSFSRILQQFWCFFQFFSKKNLLAKNPFFWNTKFLNVLKIFTYSVAFYCKFDNCSDFGKNIFFLITHLICF